MLNEVKNEIPSITDLATSTALNANNKIPNITNLATTTLTAVENRILMVANEIEKTY